MTFETVLVANRGEIARRVMRTCRERGITTVAVHSAVDAGALHVTEADRAVQLPGDPVAAYLDIDAVVAAAVETGADAIHPGYGFLSEHPDMPAACAAAGVTFIGPDADAIALMGDKAASKEAAAAAGVPVLDSIDPSGLAPDDLRTAVEGIGLPVIVKAVSGGGGKGMRRVDDLDELPTAVAAAAREGAAAFGDDRLLIERFVTAPRHVEIQVAGDSHGGATHLFERDCSIQRRHQKIVEEAPSPALDPDLRERMGAAAVALVQQVAYTNLGTVEFLLDTSDDGDAFFFLEMNTRLQVEHPVTELVTGLDLVGCQLDIAAGGHVPQRPPQPDGHAIEVRLYAEDVPAGFLPQTGRIEAFAIPAGVRVDSAVAAGSQVSSHYDPMLAKVVAHGSGPRDGARPPGRGAGRRRGHRRRHQSRPPACDPGHRCLPRRRVHHLLPARPPPRLAAHTARPGHRRRRHGCHGAGRHVGRSRTPRTESGSVAGAGTVAWQSVRWLVTGVAAGRHAPRQRRPRPASRFDSGTTPTPPPCT